MASPGIDRLPLQAGSYEPAPLADRDRRWPLSWEWWDALAILGLWLVASYLGSALLLLAGDGPEATSTTAVAVLFSTSLLVAITLSWVRLRGADVPEVASVRRLLGVTAFRPADVAMGIGYGIVAFVVVQLGIGVVLQQLIQALGGEVPEVQVTVQEAVRGDGPVPLLVALGTIVIAPVGEELLYRGVLYQALARHVPGWLAIAISGVAFGITHIEWLVIALTFPLGILLAWTVRRHGTVVVAIVAHMTFNLIGFAIIRAGAAAGV